MRFEISKGVGLIRVVREIAAWAEHGWDARATLGGTPFLGWVVGLIFFMACTSGRVWGLDQASPRDLPAGHPMVGGNPLPQRTAEEEAMVGFLREQDRTTFMAEIHLDKLRELDVQHRDQIKILDSWARQSLYSIGHRQTIDGQDPLYTALDIAFRPEAWTDSRIIYVRDVPVRQQLMMLTQDPAEQQRIMTEARVSPNFIMQPAAQRILERMQQDAILQRQANDLLTAQDTFTHMFDTLMVVEPSAAEGQRPWHHPAELAGNFPDIAAVAAKAGQTVTPLPGYDEETAGKILLGLRDLHLGWRRNDVAEANEGIDMLAASLPTVNAAAYRPAFKRSLELVYNRSFNGTLVAFVYMLAMVLFMVAAIAESPGARKAAMGTFGIAVALHLAAMLTRWYLAGRIPIQNQFESVLGAALMGCVVGLALELWRKNNLFGMAMSFVGFLAMTACFVFPFVVGTEMGANIGPVAGILSNTIWLFIHVNIVISSYALIAASFLLGTVYLAVRLWHWMNPVMEGAVPALAGGGGSGATTSGGIVLKEAQRRRDALELIDKANVVVIQLAFWLLGIGIVCGAVWADVSWGRPWGWDPKETFALVTWICYLLIVHVRFVTPKDRAMVTACLAILGFGIMMFNWIGVNFWLVGLHSYA